MYEGDYADDRFNGFGKMTYCSGDIYEGEFKDNKMHGKGDGIDFHRCLLILIIRQVLFPNGRYIRGLL